MRQEISIIFEQNRNRYGSPRVTRALRAAGKKVGENSSGPPHAPTAAGCPPQAGLSAQNHRGLWKWSAQPNRGRPSRSVPIRFGESDITYVATAEAWLYLAVILDFFSRWVVGWKSGKNLEAELVVTALQNAFLLRQPDSGLIFHSDRGCQYTSQAVREKLQAIGVLQSMCYDNARAEAFFSSLKTECFPLSNCFASKAQARDLRVYRDLLQ